MQHKNETVKRQRIVCVLLIALLILLLWANLFMGSVAIPMASIIDLLLGRGGVDEVTYNIVYKYRFPQMITALFAGAALSVSGLQMQTLFRNPLAGPSVLGVSEGAALGVAASMMFFPGMGSFFSQLTWMNNISISLAAFAGSILVLLLVLMVSGRISGVATLLIIGMMIGYVASAIIGLIQFYAHSADLKNFVMWGMGSFSSVSWEQMPFFVLMISLGLVLSLFMGKEMNLFLLGDKYAANLGVSLFRIRFMLILLSGGLVAITTSFTGPIIFLGLAVPHLTRSVFSTFDNRYLTPYCILIGGNVALCCNLISRLPGFDGALPINTITSIFGAPMVIYYVLRRKRF